MGSARKGQIDVINYLLFEQKYQKIEMDHFQYQAIEWSVVYGNKQIAQILQKYYIDYKLSKNWNALCASQDLGVEFDIFNLPSIYQEIIELIIHSDDENDGNVSVIRRYFENGCDLQFENNMPWTVAVDCTNLSVLQFLFKTIGINPCIQNNYLLRTACEIGQVEMVQFAKSIIPSCEWEQRIAPHVAEYKALCPHNALIGKELDEYKSVKKMVEIPQTPMPHKHVHKKYGIITRSKRKMLVSKGILGQMEQIRE